MSNTGLTGRQQQILDFIDSQISDRGYPPSVREIGDAVGLTSPSTVHSHLATLQEENATLLDECERLQAASKAASRPANGAGLTRRERAKATWEEDERDEERRAAEGGGKGRAGRGRRHREGSG